MWKEGWEMLQVPQQRFPWCARWRPWWCRWCQVMVEQILTLQPKGFPLHKQLDMYWACLGLHAELILEPVSDRNCGLMEEIAHAIAAFLGEPARINTEAIYSWRTAGTTDPHWRSLWRTAVNAKNQCWKIPGEMSPLAWAPHSGEGEGHEKEEAAEKMDHELMVAFLISVQYLGRW